ncbi:hypothetical protein MM300_01865 [Evansella sp. LMS18]|uniref:hypothetical protein n=1 Tax=Evansella sp. LMS18 TaxID=2924033 RepID=UPI0020D15888|nr:hypothetical protein [Evansella sp. LMS18]UTR11103.1 hypothetical protein MM300_01865 [Evansella sp. LMS18]
MKQERMTTVQLKQKVIHLRSELHKYEKKIKDYEENYHYRLLEDLKQNNEELRQKNETAEEQMKKLTNEKERLLNENEEWRQKFKAAAEKINVLTEKGILLNKQLEETLQDNVLLMEKIKKYEERSTTFLPLPEENRKAGLQRKNREEGEGKARVAKDDWFISNLHTQQKKNKDT